MRLALFTAHFSPADTLCRFRFVKTLSEVWHTVDYNFRRLPRFSCAFLTEQRASACMNTSALCERYPAPYILISYAGFRPLCPGRARQRPSAECHRQPGVPGACTVTLFGLNTVLAPSAGGPGLALLSVALKHATYSAIPTLQRSIVPARDMTAAFSPISIPSTAAAGSSPFGSAAALSFFAASTVRLVVLISARFPVVDCARTFVPLEAIPVICPSFDGEPSSAPRPLRSESA